MSPSIQRIAERNKKNGTFAACFEAVCYAFEVSRGDILRKIRTEQLVWPRFTLIWLALELTPDCKATIARRLNRDHGTIRWALDSMRQRLEVDPKFKAEAEFLRDGLRRKFEGAK